jgi:hypothetical protein
MLCYMSRKDRRPQGHAEPNTELPEGYNNTSSMIDEVLSSDDEDDDSSDEDTVPASQLSSHNYQAAASHLVAQQAIPQVTPPPTKIILPALSFVAVNIMQLVTSSCCLYCG